MNIRIRHILITMVLSLVSMASIADTDMTSSIVNPEFDGRSFAGWQQQGMQLQTNNDFSAKSNYAYAERWVSNTTTLPDTYLRQQITGLTKGRYTLTAAAQHILQGGTGDAKGAVLFADWQETAVTAAGDYSVIFDVLTDAVTIGFRVTNGTGNWMAVDNFRLTLVSTDVAHMREGLSNLVTKASTLAQQSMDATVKNTLNSAITNARKYTSSGTAANVQTAAATLKGAMLAAERSIFAVKTSTSGNVPTVVTDTRYARGATMIFGRSTVTSNASLLEQGFCYSTDNPLPTVADERTTRYVTNGGPIYCLDNLAPATLYYLRAYAVTTSYKVGYGDVIKVYTLPRGNVTWSHDNGGSDMENKRIAQSIMSVAHYWSTLTSITGFAPSAHYGSGTPTADCSYGGWIRVGPSTDYQATGTLAHEMGHGIGVGTHSTYWADIHTPSNGGFWAGKRATRFLQFWDNSEGVRLYGDSQHLWASGAKQSLSYTINGAHEDSHSDASYYGNALLMQAIVEDGLAPVSGNLQGLAYTFDHKDDVCYYIRSASHDCGLTTAYLADNGGLLQLQTLTADEARSGNYNTQWTLTFDPSTQSYRIRNKQTGRYIYYASDNTTNGFRTTTGTYNEVDLRLQLSFVDVIVGSGSDALTLDCYHIMRKTSTPSPQAMCASNSTTTASTPFSNTRDATAQRWVIVDADGLSALNDAASMEERATLDELISRIRTLATTPHTEAFSGTNQRLESTLQQIESSATNADPIALASLRTQAYDALMSFLQRTTPTGTPYDISFLIANTSVDSSAGFEGSTPTVNYSCGEFYQTAFDTYQTVSGVPAGRYVFKLQAFQRPGTSADTYNDYVNGTHNLPLTTQIYIGDNYVTACHIASGARTSKIGAGNESEVGSPVRYMPNDMQSAQAYFSSGAYGNTVETSLKVNGNALRFGIRGATSVSYDWSIFDNFRLYYYGGAPVGDVNTDGNVDVSDVTALVSIILGNVTAGSEGYDFGAADVNGDGSIDVSDVTTLVSIILGN
ncbi:MAG: dockerin type I repeat-containing protein [Bacteroidaceae bacterium]|nr:dockerin type I repeat-containing protein [Bacteroidaceae bacterium]